MRSALAGVALAALACQPTKVSGIDAAGASHDFVEAVPDADSGELVGDWVYHRTRNSVALIEYPPESFELIVVEYAVERITP